MSKYSSMLRDPRWQKKRLEIMERDKFTCLSCGAKDKTLNVHHMYYRTGKKVWEYESDSLKTLCEDCHELLAGDKKEFEETICGLEIQTIRDLFSIGVLFAQYGIEPLRLFRMFGDPEVEEQFVKAFVALVKLGCAKTEHKGKQ